MFTVYVIRSITTGKIYIGQTENITQREFRHNQDLPIRKKSYTYKNKGPWKIVYTEVFNTRQEATKRERELKTSRGRIYIKQIINKVP